MELKVSVSKILSSMYSTLQMDSHATISLFNGCFYIKGKLVPASLFFKYILRGILIVHIDNSVLL